MPRTSRQTLIGVALMLGSVLVFTVMNALTKECGLPSGQKVLFRMALGVLTVFAMIRFGWVRLEFNNIPLLALRGFFGAFAVLFYFHAIDNTTLARAVFFQFTYPAWGALFSYLFLNESLGWKRLPAFAATFVGAYFILASDGGASSPAVRPGDISGILCGLFSGAAVTTIRACHKYDPTHMIFLFFASFGSVAGAVVAFAGGPYSVSLAGRAYTFSLPGSGFVEPSTAGWLLLLAIGVTGTVAQLIFTASYRYLDVATAGSLATLQAPLAAVTGLVIFQEDLAPRFVIGAALVLVGALYLAVTSRGEVMEHVHEKPATDDANARDGVVP